MKNRGMILKALLALIVLALIGAVCYLVSVTVSSILAGQAPADTDSGSNSQSQGLTMPEDYLPQNIEIGDSVGNAVFFNEEMKAISVSELAGREANGCWIVFWASWCPDCREQLSMIEEMKRIAKENGYSLVLANRLDGTNETLEKAQKELEEQNVSDVFVVYDKDETNYKNWGVRSIPTSIVVGSDETFRAFQNGQLSITEAEGLLKLGTIGREQAVLEFLERQFSNDEGGIYCNSAEDGTIPSGHDVISESMGIMMEYAVLSKDQKLFEQTWNYVRSHMMNESGLVSWYAAENGKRGSVNAVLDDLRILSALNDASNLWDGAWEEETELMREAFLTKCLNKDGIPVDFVEFETGNQANTVSLSYLDIDLLKKLAETDERFEEVRKKSLAVLEGGYIEDSFPLYYAGYNLDIKVYNHTDINSAEGLYTIWILARAGRCPETTHEWLKERVKNADLAARYEINGKVVNGYDFHSAAVYGLAALIGRELNDTELYQLSLRRMQRYYELDASDPNFGAFGRKGETLYAFDQLIALLAYHDMK